MTLTVVPLSDALGAEVRGVDLARPIAPETAEAMRQAFCDHLILLFRGQDLSQEDLVRATACFGDVPEIARPKEYRTPGQRDLLPQIMLISNIRENGEPIGNLPDGEMMFHHDMIHAAVPHKATMLYAREVPREGGNTLFANLCLAYDTLPAEMRASLEGRKAFHHYHYGSTQKGDDRGTPAFAESAHPVFRTHDETGRKAIYVNRLMTEGIVDMDPAESARLLGLLFDHAEQRRFVYEHVWRVGDVMLWDNRCTMHARTDFSPAERRLFWRTTVAGDGPPV